MAKPNFLIPKRVTIETVFGCNASCEMCVIDQPTERKKGMMKLDLFYKIIESLLPYKDHFEMMDLFCLGEPLLDKHIFTRIKHVKSLGFKNIGFSTNADLLNDEKQDKLLESGLDTVLFSIDGVKKETHEGIRKRLNFDNILNNVCNIIEKRNQGDYKTRFVIRFIRQDSNRYEWEEYKEFWKAIISPERNDFITCYDMHTWGGDIALDRELIRDPEIDRQACPDIHEIMYILADGSIPLCNEDWLHPTYNFGNAKDNNPIEIWNSPRFQKIREIHQSGKKCDMEKCKDCTVAYSAANKEVVKI